MLCYPEAPHQRPQPLLTLSPDRIVLQKSSRRECTSGVCVNMADFCMSFCIVLLLQKAHLKKERERLLNSERECVQGIFASTYGSLFKGERKAAVISLIPSYKLPPLSA